MNKEKIACIAGTPIDTEMGVELLKKEGFDAYPFPSSKTPADETLFQHSSIDKKNEKILHFLLKIKALNINKVFVYCNSLSSAVDFVSLSKETNLKIITPYNAYEEIAKKYNSLGIIAANAVATSMLEKFFIEANNNISLITIGILPLVNSIEKHLPPQEIIKYHNLDSVCKWFEKNYCEAILLGCTHFPYLLKELKELSNIPIIEPSKRMLELL